MATKPTERILDWASGGTTTDPGGAKEAAGWVVDDRPPANWWNWILNSFGKWLTWAEASIDELPDRAEVCRAAVKISTDATPTIVWDGVVGPALTSVTYSGSDVYLNFSSPVVAVAADSVVHVTGTGGTTGSGFMFTTSQARCELWSLSSGTQLACETVEYTIQVTIWGAAP